MTNPTKQVKHEIEYHFTSKAFKEHNKEMRDEGKKEALEDELKFLWEYVYHRHYTNKTMKNIQRDFRERITEIKQKLEKT